MMPQLPVEDELLTIKLTTPAGMLVTVEVDQTPAHVQALLADRNDSTAAGELCALSGCMVTVERTQLSTVAP